MDILGCINDDIPCMGDPVDVRVSRGRLRCKLPCTDNELVFNEIEGELIGIERVKWRGWPYWEVTLRDEANTFHVLFFLKSAMFVYLLRCLIGRAVKQLSVQVGTLTDGSTQMIVEGDGKRLEPQPMNVPKTRRHRKKEGVNAKDWKDYTDRLKFTQELVNRIGATLGRA